MFAPRPPWPVLLTALLLAPVALLAPACDKGGASTQVPSEDPVDALTLALLDALSDADREAVAGLTSPALQAELGERDLAVIARTLHWLGPVTLDMQREEAVVGGRARTYLARFDRGSIELEIVVVGDALEGFAFDEASWSALVERATEVSAGSLRVAEFNFQSPEGAPLPAPTDPGDVRYQLVLEGLDAQLREHHVRVAKVVYDDAGRLVYRQTEGDDLRFPQAEAGSSGGRVTGTVAVPGPGRYALELEIHDLIADQSLSHRIEFELP